MRPILSNIYELVKVDLHVGICVHSEEVPEDIVEFAFGCLLQNFNSKAFKLSLFEISLLASIVLIKVFLELVPNGLHEFQLLFRHSCKVRRRVFAGTKIQSIAEVFLNEISILVESDESVMVGVQFVEDIGEIFLAGSNLDEEAVLSKQ